MKNRAWLALAALLPLASGPAAASPDALDKRVSLDISGATTEEAFKSVARAAGVQIKLDGVSGDEVNLKLENARVRTVLTALCDDLRCRWEFDDGNPPTLRVTPEPGAGAPKPDPAALDAQIDITVTDADARDLLETVAEIMSARASIDPAVKGKVSLALKKTPVSRILDATCSAVGCDWTFDEGKGALVVKARKR